jgi:AhpD family alkylhydroperoxidase
MTWLPERGAGEDGFASVIALRPNLAAELRAFDELLWSGGPIDPALLELCRLRIAGLHGCAAERARRRTALVGDSKRVAVDRWRESDAFSERERAALALAEKFALEPHAATDADVAAVTSRMTAPEFVALVQGLGLADGFTRFRIVLDVDVGSAGSAGTAGGSARAGAADAASVAPTRTVRSRPDRVPTSSPRLAPPEAPGADAISSSVLAHQPELLRAFLRLYGTLWSHGVVDHPTKEVLRIRNARVTDCNYCKNVRFSEARRQGLDEASVSLVDDGWEASSLSERHKAALRLADAFLLDPHGLTREVRARLLEHFSAPEIVEMTAGLALFMGFSKITVVLGREPVAMPTTVVPTPNRPA